MRLFLSVDLVGSTAFKARFGEEPGADGPYPIWVTQIRHFYREFPQFVAKRYSHTISGQDGFDQYKAAVPTPWKTIGDEILFCCRLHSVEHLACCVRSFLGALDDYGTYLDSSQHKLDVKGSGWVAAFPAPNISVEIAGPSEGSEQVDEEFEARADESPSDFDFLGKAIDSGFRAAKYASADKFTPSIELAWLLSEACHQNLFQHRFFYHGRQTLKGVIDDHPYPIISIDAERSANKRALRVRERVVTGERDAEAINLKHYLEAFMTEEGMDLPALPRHGLALPPEALPKSYVDFQTRWNVIAEENQKRRESELAAAEPAADMNGGELPAALGEALDDAVARTEAGRQ